MWVYLLGLWVQFGAKICNCFPGESTFIYWSAFTNNDRASDTTRIGILVNYQLLIALLSLHEAKYFIFSTADLFCKF